MSAAPGFAPADVPGPDPGATWRVRRTAGLLPPGFSKRFAHDGRSGLTRLGPVGVGRFSVEPASGGVELRYVAWPVVDELEQPPGDDPWQGTGRLRLPGGRRLTFCRFDLERD